MTIKRTFKILLFIFSVLGLYILCSLFLLNGRITYWTSFNKSTVAESKEESLFMTSDLQIRVRGDSLSDWQNKFDIWTNKRYEIKYFGFLFYWTYSDPSWRYLNIKPKSKYIDQTWSRSKLYINQQETDYMKNFTGGYEACCNWIACKQNDTVKIAFIRTFQQENILGTISLVVK